MFNVGAGELVFILVAALLILGPTRLPELARGLGKFMREFRRQTDEVRGTLEREFYRMDQDLAREEPPAAPPRAAAAEPAPPPAFPLPSLPPPPLEPAPLEAAPLEPAAPLLGGVPPALDPSVARTQVLEPVSPEAAQALLQAPEPAAAAPEAAAPDAPPRMAPVPGTVSRNALKRPSEEI